MLNTTHVLKPVTFTTSPRPTATQPTAPGSSLLNTTEGGRVFVRAIWDLHGARSVLGDPWVGGWVVDLPLWKMMEWKSVGIIIPNIWKTKKMREI